MTESSRMRSDALKVRNQTSNVPYQWRGFPLW